MQQNTLGNIAYEITNYLGNVNVVISDRKIWTGTPINAFRAVILSKTDYTACTRISWLNKEYGIMPTLISLNKEDIINRRHYFPFGMLNDTWFSGTESLSGVNPEWSLSGTSGEISSRTTSTQEYRYGYKGMLNDTWFSGTESLSGVNPEWSFSGTSGEQDPEAKGEGNSYTTEFRQYDSRIGRWLSLDPLMAQYPMMSPYVAFNNNPIYFVDPFGLEGDPPGGDNENWGNEGCEMNDGNVVKENTERIIQIKEDKYTYEKTHLIEVSIKHGLGNGPNKSLGGKLGGHVGITLGDQTYGFSNTIHGTHIFGRGPKGNRDGFFAAQPKWDSVSGDSYNVVITTFEIPVSEKQYNDLESYYKQMVISTGGVSLRGRNNSKNFSSPYDYALINGERCASSAFLTLEQFNIIPNSGNFHALIQINPGNVYRFLLEYSVKNNLCFSTSNQFCIFTAKELIPYNTARALSFEGVMKKYNLYYSNIVNKIIRNHVFK